MKVIMHHGTVSSAAARALQAAAGVACGGALFLASPAARADEVQDHVDRAEELSKAERHRDALGELRAAYALRPSPRLRYLMARAELRLGDARAALADYEGFLTAAPDADATLRHDAQEQVARLRRLLPPPPPPPPLPAPVRFEARGKGDQYHIVAGSERCDTPCQLSLAPGRQRISVTGEGAFDFDARVPRRGGNVRVQYPWNGQLKAGIALMTLGAAMTIAGNVALLYNLDGDGDPSGGRAQASWSVGWILGPIVHVVGIGLMGGGLAKLPDTNTVRPVTFDLAPAAKGSTARVTFAF